MYICMCIYIYLHMYIYILYYCNTNPHPPFRLRSLDARVSARLRLIRAELVQRVVHGLGLGACGLGFRI